MFTSTDVYSAASTIGQELQLLVDEHGPDDAESLMLKVITVLEDLEQCVNLSNESESKIAELQSRHEMLKAERSDTMDIQNYYTKNLDQLQQSWYKETQALFDEVATLELENHNLQEQVRALQPMFESQNLNVEIAKSTSISAIVKAAASGCDKNTITKAESGKLGEINVNDILSKIEVRLSNSKLEDLAADLQLISQLKLGIAEQTMEIRQFRKKILQCEASLDAAEEEVCRLARQSGVLFAEYAPHRRQVGQLTSEKTEVETRLCVCEQDLKHLSGLLETSYQLENAATCAQSASLTLPMGRTGLQHTARMPLHISPGQGAEAVETAPTAEYHEDNLLSLEQLRSLLYERNELRCRLIELQTKLEILEGGEEEELLFGPMPMEPMEKLRPGFAVSQVGIKTMFTSLLRRVSSEAQRSGH